MATYGGDSTQVVMGDCLSGNTLGMTATSPVGMHGLSCVQANAITALVATDATTTCYTTVNSIITALKNKGILA
jgi:NAD(P)H-hydrate repair Nnr-like enzyme with NAD(P)H-hydrate dehydratase domain